MSQSVSLARWVFALFSGARLATSVHVGGSDDFLGKKAVNPNISNSTLALHAHVQAPDIDIFTVTLYGKSKCPCVGIDNIRGYYATNLDFYHVQYPLEAGSSCFPWDLAVHPECEGGGGPGWCSQRWCYVDPCNCQIDDLPGVSSVGVEYQGSLAYWSYDTCGFTDLYSAAHKNSCIAQQNQSACGKRPKCAWDGAHNRCGGEKAIETCKNALQLDETIHGQDDCRCVGLAGRSPGKAYLYIDDDEQMAYPADVGSTCKAWEADTHPECTKTGEEVPEWCGQSWCFVDPCNCKTAIPPKIVMEANQNLKFQGKTAFWSPETCGSEDTWTKAHAGKYCITQLTEEDCGTMGRCAWDAKRGACLGKGLVEVCGEQQLTGILGFEVGQNSGSIGLGSFAAVLVLLRAFVEG